jgi:hypothetical protein
MRIVGTWLAVVDWRRRPALMIGRAYGREGAISITLAVIVAAARRSENQKDHPDDAHA